MPTCPVCTADVSEGARFCEKCGSPNLAPGARSSGEIAGSAPTPSADAYQQAPYQQVPNQQAPYQQVPNQQAPYQQVPNQQAPYQQVPNQQAPYQQAPNQQAPYQQVPNQQAPYQQAPNQQAPYQQVPYQQGLTGYPGAYPGYTGQWPQPGAMPGISQFSYAAQSTPVSAFGAPLASWLGRVGAMLLDGLILAIPSVIIFVVLLATSNHVQTVYTSNGYVTEKSLAGGQLAVYLIVNVSINCLYFALFNGSKRGQTLGNMAAGIAVRDAITGHPIGFWRGVARFVVRSALYLVLAIPGLVSDLMPLWDSRRQTLADKAVRSVMVKV